MVTSGYIVRILSKDSQFFRTFGIGMRSMRMQHASHSDKMAKLAFAAEQVVCILLVIVPEVHSTFP
jgi:hypothetical protein